MPHSRRESICWFQRWSSSRARCWVAASLILILIFIELISYKTMGLGLQKCCSPAASTYGDKEFSRIADTYLGDITNYSNVSDEVPHYHNVMHCCLVNKLIQYDLKFTDELNPYSLMLNDSSWSRITDVYPSACFRDRSYRIEPADDNLSSHASKSFLQALSKLQNYPDLVDRIFPNQQVSKVGFYALYFCINGNVEDEKKRQIVIDDYIPVDNYGQYLGTRLKPSSGIWGLLIEKALAKCLGSYNLIQFLTADQIFSEITGVPVPSLYHQNQFLVSSLHQFTPEESKYIRVGVSTETSLLFAIWQPCNEIQGHLGPHHNGSEIAESFIFDLIPEAVESEDLFEKIRLKRVQNKMIITDESGNMLTLQKGRYIAHVFNRSNAKITCNFVIHSTRQIPSPMTVYGETYMKRKHSLIKKMYQKVHMLSPVVYEQPGIALRMAWLGPRAVLCLKNESNENKPIEIEIISKKIFFEDHKDSRCLTHNLVPGHHEIFVFIIRSDHKSQQFGQFYRIRAQQPRNKH